MLWLRQLKRYVRSRARLFSAIAQPLLFLIAFGFGFGPMYARSEGGDYIQFLAPGIMTMSMLFVAMFGGIEIIWDKQFGFLKETLVAPVPRIVIMLGRTLGGATVAMVQGVLVFFITLLVGFRPVSGPALLLAPVFMFLISLLFTAVGTAIASRLNEMHAFPLLMNLLIMPLFLLSGALFPVEGLPAAFALVVKLNPLTYGADGMRLALSGDAHFAAATDIAVLASFAAVALMVGAYLFRRIEA